MLVLTLREKEAIYIYVPGYEPFRIEISDGENSGFHFNQLTRRVNGVRLAMDPPKEIRVLRSKFVNPDTLRPLDETQIVTDNPINPLTGETYR